MSGFREFCTLILGAWATAAMSFAGEAQFYRAFNLNGPPLSIESREWEGNDATNFTFKGGTFENQAVPLRPPAEANVAKMLRSSVWGSNAEVTVSSVPDGAYQLFLYVWEDNHSERFDLLVNGQVVLDGFHSGSKGSWRKLGPWSARPVEGKIKVSSRAGAANLSGLEIWAGDGEIPMPPKPEFVTELTTEQTDFFEKRIRPLLAYNCYQCHSATAQKLGGGLLLDSRAGIVSGGDSGAVITPGSPDASLLIQAVKRIDPELSMPPKTKLQSQEISDLEAWIKMGAPDPRTGPAVAAGPVKRGIDWDQAREFWSFRPVQKPGTPKVLRADWPSNEIDYFILEKLEQSSLAPAAAAEKRVLIRRATYDLTGLPPTPEEVEAFVRDESPDAFAKVIDRLLGSEHYGERWGRHWLDVVRYADSAGDNSDFPIPQMYRYRNWVISAFNRDLPYDKFVRQQLAGDLLPAENEEQKHEQVIATGYIANARRFGSRVSDYPQHLTIEDTIDNLGRAFLGLTVSCARCHDHKFDPIPNEDYYALYGIFHSTRYPWPGIELDQKQKDLIPLVPREVVEAALQKRKATEKKLNAEVERLEKEVKAAKDEEKKKLEKALADAKSSLEKHRRGPLPFPQAYAVAEASKIEDVPVQLKGDPAKPGEVVPRGFLKVLNGGAVPREQKSSGRLQLADWIVSTNNPLTARVMVNRLWLYHFGKGLVATPNDYGKQGKPPTHPELLDWLAARFMENGWSIKSMHRLIMLSRTYQMASGLSSEALERDPANQLLSAFPRRRLDAESIRDTLLVLGGTLDRTIGGEHPFPPQTEWKFTQHNPFKAVYETQRRSVYLMTQRIARHPFLAIFDGPDPAASTGSRLSTTTPVQALYLLNDPFVHEQAKRFAAQIISEAGDDRTRWKLAIERALARQPDEAETGGAMQMLATIQSSIRERKTAKADLEFESWQAMTRAIFRMNEFIYID